MGVNELFKTIILVQLFYAFAITSLAYAIPDNAKVFLDSFSDITGEVNLESVSEDVYDNLDRQTNIPVLEVGTLVFYSGNILLDLLLNFVTAIPQMIGLLIHGITALFSIDSYLFAQVELFSGVVISILYVIGLIEFLASIRSGRVIS